MNGAIPKGMVAAFVLSLALLNPYVRGDGNGYYAWLTSPVIDHDLDFRNQYAQGDPFFRSLAFDADGSLRPEMTTVTGHAGNQWSVGPAVLWAPWFLTAHISVIAARAAGVDVAADGYAWPYRWAVAAGTACYGLLALVLSHRVALRLGLGGGATLAVLAVWLASPLPVYQYFVPFHVHALAAFSVAWFTWFWIRHRLAWTTSRWWQWGLIAGLMTETYHLNAVLLVIVAYEWATAARRAGLRRAATAALALAAGAVVAWMPQMIGKTIVYGAPFATGYQDTFVFADPRLWQTAFSANHGLVTWTPLVIIGLVGLGRLAHRPEIRVSLIAMALFYLVVASYQNWHGQSSFGNRFFLSLMIWLVVGVADVAAWAAGRPGWRLAMPALLALLAVWNAGLAYQWGTNVIPNRGPVDFREVARNQVTVVPAGVGRFMRRYFSSRADLVHDLEKGDARERENHRVIR